MAKKKAVRKPVKLRTPSLEIELPTNQIDATHVKTISTDGIGVRCSPGAICSVGTAQHGSTAATRVVGKVYEVADAVPDSPPTEGVTEGTVAGINWSFTAADGNLLPHLEMAVVGKQMKVAVWGIFDSGTARDIVTFSVGFVGNVTDCDVLRRALKKTRGK